MVNKRRKIEESSKDLKESQSERRVRFVSDSDEDESLRNVVGVSDSDSKGNPESGLGLTSSVLELDSTETVWNQVVLQKLYCHPVFCYFSDRVWKDDNFHRIIIFEYLVLRISPET